MNAWAFISIFLGILTSIFYYEDMMTGFCACLYSLCMCGVFSCMGYNDLKNRVKNLEKQLKEREEK